MEEIGGQGVQDEIVLVCACKVIIFTVQHGGCHGGLIGLSDGGEGGDGVAG